MTNVAVNSRIRRLTTAGPAVIRSAALRVHGRRLRAESRQVACRDCGQGSR